MAPTSSVLNSLFKDEEPSGFNFNQNEEKKKQLALQRRAEYNAYLEKKEKEQLEKKAKTHEKKSITPKSILESVDYEQVLAKRKEEEAKFRTINHADILQSSSPVLKEVIQKPISNSISKIENLPEIHRLNGIIDYSPPQSTISVENINTRLALVQQQKTLAALEAENARLLEERIAKQLEEQRRQLLLGFENELRKNNRIKEEIQILQSATNSVPTSPKRVVTPKTKDVPKITDVPKFGRTGGGGEPVRDSYGNLITIRGVRNDANSDAGSIMSFPSMQQQPIKDRMALYREELQKQIEEKKRLEAIEKAKAKEVEDKVAQRIEEQRLAMLKEYESEMQKNNKVKEEFQRQQERIRKLEEFQRQDAEARRKKLLESKPPEQENIPPNFVEVPRSQSPPIPAVRTKTLLEKAVPAPEVRRETSLSAIRRQIKKEQEKSKKEMLNSYKVMNRRTVQEVSDDEDDILQSSFQSSN